METIADNVEATSFRDTGLTPSTAYSYQVRLAGGREPAAASLIVRTQPPVVLDAMASVLDAKNIELRWPKSAAADVVGYHVERANVGVESAHQVAAIESRYRPVPDTAVGAIQWIGHFLRLTQKPVAETRFVDTAVDLTSCPHTRDKSSVAFRRRSRETNVPPGKPYPLAVYAYRLIAVNRLGVESGPSPLVFTYPAAVQHVFAKEEDNGRTRVRWAPSQQRTAGYVVCRYDGRWDKDTISRLTPQPIQATEFLDERAGSNTRRYEVVAVDVLGQEGEPSQPVWGRREWRKYYAPYVGEWHQ
jgi:hypothetical protein